jgi:GNAT superfamily N-acetyltransferase
LRPAKSDSGPTFREAGVEDIPALTEVRLSVRENRMSREQLEALDITEASVAASFAQHAKGWVAEQGGRVVGFAIADWKAASVFALFVLPDYEGRGVGGTLLDLALDWLCRHDIACVWLTTGAHTRATAFYKARGWRAAGLQPNGELRFELRRR